MNIRPILVLNRSWTAIALTPVMRALSLVYRGHARIVDPQDFSLHEWSDWVASHSISKDLQLEDEDAKKAWLNTPSLRIQAPQIVTLACYNGIPSRYLAYSRKALFRRDRNTCQYCAATPGARNLTVDHVLPSSRQGKTNWLNCVVSCSRCNVRKGDRTPDEAGMRLARAPYRPSYLEALRVDGEFPPEWNAFVGRSKSKS